MGNKNKEREIKYLLLGAGLTLLVMAVVPVSAQFGGSPGGGGSFGGGATGGGTSFGGTAGGQGGLSGGQGGLSGGQGGLGGQGTVGPLGSQLQGGQSQGGQGGGSKLQGGTGSSSGGQGGQSGLSDKSGGSRFQQGGKTREDLGPPPLGDEFGAGAGEGEASVGSGLGGGKAKEAGSRFSRGAPSGLGKPSETGKPSDLGQSGPGLSGKEGGRFGRGSSGMGKSSGDLESGLYPESPTDGEEGASKFGNKFGQSGMSKEKMSGSYLEPPTSGDARASRFSGKQGKSSFSEEGGDTFETKQSSSKNFFEFVQEGSRFAAPTKGKAQKKDIVAPTLDLDLTQDEDLTSHFGAALSAAKKVAKLKTSSMSKVQSNAVVIAQNIETLFKNAELDGEEECGSVLNDFSAILGSKKVKVKDLKKAIVEFAEEAKACYADNVEEIEIEEEFDE